MIPLDSQPKAGQKITKQSIIHWIKSKKGSFNYKWKGKNTAVIQQLTRTTGIDLLNKAQSALKNHLEKQKYDSIVLTTKAHLKDSPLPLSAFTVLIPNEYPTAKQVCVRLNSGKHSIPVWFRVKAYQKVLVARYKIKNHTVVNAKDFILEKRNIAGLKETPYTQMPQTVWLKKSINSDRILTQKYLTDTPAVIKGQSVQVKVLNHGVSIITEAIAQHDGSIGQKIRVKNAQTNKYLVAVVTAPNQAEIPS